MDYKNSKAQTIKFNVKKRTNDKATSIILTCLAILSAFVCLFVVTVSSVFGAAEVVGESMAPTINAKSYFGEESKNQVAFYSQFSKIKKGDIIIVDYEKANIRAIDAIKRLIATSGDTICFYNGRILINGVALKETYLDSAYKNIKDASSQIEADDWLTNGYEQSKTDFNNFCQGVLDGTFTTTSFAQNYSTKFYGCIKYNNAIQGYVLTIPQDYVFFLGDNRGNSVDGSDFGPIERKHVVAKVNYIAEYGSNIFKAMWRSLFN